MTAPPSSRPSTKAASHAGPVGILTRPPEARRNRDLLTGIEEDAINESRHGHPLNPADERGILRVLLSEPLHQGGVLLILPGQAFHQGAGELIVSRDKLARRRIR
jgi:hypothetical protein